MTCSRRNRFLNSTRIAGLVRNATGTRVCARTVRNRLRSARLRARRPYVGIPLTRAHRHARLNWTRVHRRWPRRMWNQVLLTDESRFNLMFADGRVSVWRRDGERMDPANVIQHDRFGGGKVMVLGGISYRGKTYFVAIQGNLNAVRYCTEIVMPVVLPFLRQGLATIFSAR